MRDVVIRPLATPADYAACVALQRETWGAAFEEVVPPSMLQVSQRLGGVAGGAFDGAGRLIGFVYGITGVEHGAIVHWSDMLAVRPEARNLGLGRRLKEFQRRAVARVGGRIIYWTYDPLVARNAHLNFNVFGVRVVEYVPDMYGPGTSDLHRGIGTDRLIVAWPVDDAELEARRAETAAARDAHPYRAAAVIGDPERGGHDALADESPWLRLAVPLDVAVVQQHDLPRAARWRAASRDAFARALALGYRVDGFTVDAEGERGYYLLTRQAR